MGKRAYRQNCALAQAADLLGERWTLLILRELLIQPCQFSELATYLDGIGSNLLAERLKAHEAQGLIEKQDADNKRSPYRLTAAGHTVEPLILELIRWGYRFGRGHRDYAHEDHWDLLAMRAFFDPDRCRRPMRVQFIDDSFAAWVQVAPAGFRHGIGRIGDTDLQIETTIARFQADVAAGRYADDQRACEFIGCFDVPLRASVAAA